MTRVVPALLFCLLAAACGDSEAPSSGARTPALSSPSASVTLGAVSGEVQIIVESRVTSAGDRGTFTMTGEINDSGIVITRRSRQEDAVVKERELRSDLGTLFIHIEGSLRDDGTAVDFTWRVTGATDGYEGLTGGGSGTDEFIGTTNLRGELEGTVSR